MTNNNQNEEQILYPPTLEEWEAARSQSSSLESVESVGQDPYVEFLESQCGAIDDSQPVEQYDGRLGVSKSFVATHQAKVGQVQWNSDLASNFTNAGNVNSARWCTGTMISDNLFLTAAHCFEQPNTNTSNWRLPRVNGTNTFISPQVAAQNMHINFNFQTDASGQARTEIEVAIEELVEIRLGNLDYAIVRLADTPGFDFGIAELSRVDGNVNDMLCIIGHPAGVPKRIEAGPLTTFDGDRVRYNSIDTLGGNSGSAIWHAASGTIVGVHTNGGCERDGTGSNFGVRIESLLKVSPILRGLVPPKVLDGLFHIQQKSNNRFVDAHEGSSNDFSAVTRAAQNNSTQDWVIRTVGTVYTVQQLSSGHYLDAHENTDNDFSVVGRDFQNNDTQRWVFQPSPYGICTYTIQQLSSGRYLDAYHSSNSKSAVTRNNQNNATQRWIVTPQSDGSFTIQQESTGNYLDAYHSDNDRNAVMRSAQNNDTQKWILRPTGTLCTLRQNSSDRFLDAHENDANDFNVVTRTAQDNDTQKWVIIPAGGNDHTIQQLSNGRYLDAHENNNNDFSLVTRTRQNNETQRWLIS